MGGDSLESAFCYNCMVTAFVQLGRMEGARALLNRALAIQTQLAPGSLHVATTLSNMGALAASEWKLLDALMHHNEALEIVKAIVPESFWLADAHMAIGSVMIRLGKFDEALQHYVLANNVYKKLAPHDSVHSFYRVLCSGRLCASMESTEQTLRTILAAAKSQHVDASNRLIFARACMTVGEIFAQRGGQNEQVRAVFRLGKGIMKKHPDSPEKMVVCISLARDLRQHGELEGGSELVESVLRKLELSPQSISQFANEIQYLEWKELAFQLYIDEKKYVNAYQHAAIVLADTTHSNNPKVWFLKGQIHGRENRLEAAISMYERALQLDASFVDASLAREELEQRLCQPMHMFEEPPTQLLCPITQEVMDFPVMAADGHTYERDAIQEYFSRNKSVVRSPVTNQALPSLELIPNHAIRSMVREWQEVRNIK